MERRTQFKVQELGVHELVDELLARGLTYEEIASAVRERTGEDVGKSSIARYNQQLQRKLRRIVQVKESAEALSKVVSQQSGQEVDTRMAEMLLATIQYSLLDKLGEDEIATRDLVQLAFAGNDAVRSATALEKLRHNERRRYAKAWETVLADARRILEASPFWRDIEALLIKARDQATAT